MKLEIIYWTREKLWNAMLNKVKPTKRNMQYKNLMSGNLNIGYKLKKLILNKQNKQLINQDQ